MGEWKRKSAGILIEGIDPRQAVFRGQKIVKHRFRKIVKHAYPIHNKGMAVTGGAV